MKPFQKRYLDFEVMKDVKREGAFFIKPSWKLEGCFKGRFGRAKGGQMGR
jgi:hypothetical protein